MKIVERHKVGKHYHNRVMPQNEQNRGGYTPENNVKNAANQLKTTEE